MEEKKWAAFLTHFPGFAQSRRGSPQQVDSARQNPREAWEYLARRIPGTSMDVYSSFLATLLLTTASPSTAAAPSAKVVSPRPAKPAAPNPADELRAFMDGLVGGVEWTGQKIAAVVEQLESARVQSASDLRRLTAQALKGSLGRPPLGSIRLLPVQTFEAQEILAMAAARVQLLEKPLLQRLRGFDSWVQSRNAWRRVQSLMGETEDFSGSWRMEERHDMERFLERLGFNPLQRAAVLRAGQVQVIAKKAGRLHIVTRDIRGSSELVLPLDGGAVAGEGDNKRPVRYRAFREGGALVVKETAAGTGGAEGEVELSICRRTLSADGRMCIDVRKRTPQGDMVSMRVVFTRAQGEG